MKNRESLASEMGAFADFEERPHNIRKLSYVAKGLLPSHVLGSGIKRALEEWPEVDVVDDWDSCLFTAMVYRMRWPV